MADRYASVSGSGTAATLAAPSALADCLANTNGVTINAGDVVWIRGGTYLAAGSYFSQAVNGTATAPVIYRAYPGEHSIIDARNSTSGGISTSGQFVWYWDLEMTDSDTVRSNTPDGFHDNQTTNHVKYINCIIHDVPGNGILAGANVGSMEIYGTLFYYCGGASNQRHSIYFGQLPTSPYRAIKNNIMFDSGGYNLHGFADGDGHYNLNSEFNIAFQAGRLSSDTALGANMLLGITNNSPLSVFNGVRCNNNYMYCIDNGFTNLDLGYQWGLNGLEFSNNYIVGGNQRWTGVTYRGPVMTGNFVEGNLFDNGVAHFPTAGQWPGNTFTDDGSRPGSGKVIKRTANVYEPGRLHVAIFNWDHSSTVAVDISADDAGKAGIRVGDDYAIYWAPMFAPKTPCLNGTYAGGTVSIPMTAGVLGAMPNPIDPAMLQPPTTALPEFGAFIVQTLTRRN